MAFANDWQWMFGLPILAGIVARIAPATDEITLHADKTINAFLVAAIGVGITFALRFCTGC